MRSLFPLVLTLAVALGGCSRESVESQQEPAPPPIEQFGDLSLLQARGSLRVLVAGPERSGPPTARELSHEEADLLVRFAVRTGLALEWVFVPGPPGLVSALLEGRGDLLTSGAHLNQADWARVSRSVPVETLTERLAMRATEADITRETWGDRVIAVRTGSAAHQELVELQADHPGLGLTMLPDSLSDARAIDALAIGGLDLAVVSNRAIKAAVAAGVPVRAAESFGGDHLVAWALRPNSPQLEAAVNLFLNESRVLSAPRSRHKDDLAGIRARGVLRVLTRASSASYFVWRGQLLGFEYELVRELAQRERLHLEMVIPPPEADLIDWLLEGRGDMIAASLAVSDERRARGIEFTRRYHQAVETLVTRHDDEVPTLEALAGRTVVVNAGSSYWSTVQSLQARGVDVALEPPPEPLGTDEIISRVADGEFDLTVADSHIIAMEQAWRDDILAGLPLGEPVDHGWAVRSDNPELLATLDRFVRAEYRGLYYNIVYDRYFACDAGDPSPPADARFSEALSPWDDLVRAYAANYGFDWRLVLAQMYQESRFDPDARSAKGAVGLMQMLPSTAGELGFEAVDDPEAGIHAGVKYLAWLRDRFEPGLTVHDRTWFTLAAYNAGYGHVQDARRLAAQLGLDPDRWFDNVEEAMLLLSRPSHAQSALHGYCRGREPVSYVRRIRTLFAAYSQTVES